MRPAEPAPRAGCWLHTHVHPARSDIAGTGLRSTAPITAGTVVSRLGGRLVGTAELRALRAEVPTGYVDSIAVDEDVHLVLSPGNANRFGNHSCDPNLGWADEYTLVALRDIAAGAELTSDYATSTADPDFVLRCHCGTYRCRGIVAGDDWRIPELQRRYAGRWVPMLQRCIEAGLATGTGRVDGLPSRPLNTHIAAVASSATRALRRSVLRPQWPADAPMHGDESYDAIHLAALTEDDEVVAACLLLPRPYGGTDRGTAEDAWQLRGMAVAEGLRGTGLGGQILAEAMWRVRERGGHLLWCESRSESVGFYLRHGFALEGPQFAHPETGMPHRLMWRAVV